MMLLSESCQKENQMIHRENTLYGYAKPSDQLDMFYEEAPGHVGISCEFCQF